MTTSTASSLDSLVGLESAKKLVLRLARGDLGAHAVLIYGAPGSGKNEIAHLLAQAWLCLNPGEEGADGTCRACSLLRRENNSDFLLVQPQGPSRLILGGQIRLTQGDKGKPEDKVPLLNFLPILPITSRHKVAIIEDAHRMNATSANSLLKSLEEPFPHAKLILTTDSIGSIIPTILSRCLAVACDLPSHDELLKLAPEFGEDLIRLADGAPGKLMQVGKKPDAYRRLATFARSLQGRPVAAALAVSDEFREVADALATSTMNARTSNSQALELLAMFLAREPGVPPSWTLMVVDAHRRIIGNASAGMVFDALFAAMLAENAR